MNQRVRAEEQRQELEKRLANQKHESEEQIRRLKQQHAKVIENQKELDRQELEAERSRLAAATNTGTTTSAGHGWASMLGIPTGYKQHEAVVLKPGDVAVVNIKPHDEMI